MEQLGMLRTSPSTVNVTMLYSWRTGWSCRFSTPGTEPGTWAHSEYEGLSTTELHDVVCAELGRILVLDEERS